MAKLKIGSNYDALGDYIQQHDLSPIIDFREFIARQAVDSLISSITFEVDEKCNDKLVQDFVDNVKNNGYNDLIRLIRGCEWNASKDGAFYAGFEMINNNVVFYSATSSLGNYAIKINDVVDYAIIIDRIIVSSPFGDLRVRDCIFKDGYSRYNMSPLPLSGNKLNLDMFTIPSDTYINKSNFKSSDGTQIFIKTNYDMLTCKQFLNTDKKLHANESVFHLADCYPASGIISLINNFLRFMRDEPDLNYTKVIGRFSNQDIQAYKIKNKPLDTFNSRNGLSIAQYFGGSPNDDIYATQNLLKEKMFIQTNGDPKNTIVSQPSTFNGTVHSDYLKSLMSKAADLSGYSYDDNSTAMYKNEAEVANVNKNVYETTKKKQQLRTKDWYDLFGRALYVYAINNGVEKVKARKEYYDKVKELINFEIVSNLLMDHLNNDDRVINLYTNGLLDKESAIRIVNNTKSEEEIEEIIKNSEIERENYLDSINGMVNPKTSDNRDENAFKRENKSNKEEKIGDGKDKQ